MAVLTVKWQSKIKSHSDAIDYFKELPFYNKSIKKPKVKRLKNIDRHCLLCVFNYQNSSFVILSSLQYIKWQC